MAPVEPVVREPAGYPARGSLSGSPRSAPPDTRYSGHCRVQRGRRCQIPGIRVEIADLAAERVISPGFHPDVGYLAGSRSVTLPPTQRPGQRGDVTDDLDSFAPPT